MMNNWWKTTLKQNKLKTNVAKQIKSLKRKQKIKEDNLRKQLDEDPTEN